MRLKKYLLVLLASVLSGFAVTVTADDWPSKPVRIIVSFPPGGSSDLVARLIGQQLSEKYGQQFIVDNRPGAGGTVAGELLKQQSGDGYTFMLSNLAPFTIAPTQFETIPYDPLADFTHASYIGAVHMGIIVSPELGVTDLAGLVAKAKAEPGMLNYGSSGVGSWSHVIGEYFKSLAGVDIVHIPYKGSGPMRQDFKAGVIPIYFDALAQNLPSIKAGEAVALGVTAPDALAIAPDIPTFKAQGFDIVVENWLGFTAPKGLDPELTANFDAAVKEAIARPEVQAQFANWGLVHTPMSSQAFTDFVQQQINFWRPLIIAANAAE